MKFDAWIDGPLIRCRITSDEHIAAPIFRCAAIGPIMVAEGLNETRRFGGYVEGVLPDLSPGVPCLFALRYVDPNHAPVNRAWLPLGASLKAGDRIIALPELDTGARPLEIPDVEIAEGHLPVVPQPTRWDPDGGVLSATGFAGHHEALDRAAELAGRLGLGAFLRSDGIPVDFQISQIEAEGYQIEIDDNGISILHADAAGAFYAAVTILQLWASTNGQLPTGRITDAPRFSWRGQHLDCARHYFQSNTIADLLDLMALLKLNRFHWHFADDEAFRLEVECVPELWQKSCQRGDGHILPALFGENNSGGSYTKSDVQRIVTHAKRLHIEVLPEIEVPAHSLCITQILPETRDPDDVGDEQSVQGYPVNAMNPAMPAAWHVWESLVDEIGPLFPFGHLHLGCDELPARTWQGSPAAQRLMAREGLADTDDLQGWTMAKLAARVVQNGQRPCAWEEAAKGANGGIGNGALLFSWTGQGPGLEAARAGYDVVMTPGQHAYFDMARSADPDDWGAAWAAFIGLADTVIWDPVPEGAEDVAHKIKGVQGTFWGEFTTRDAQLWPMIMPRLLGLAMMAWQPRGTQSPEALMAQARRFGDVWRAPDRN